MCVGCDEKVVSEQETVVGATAYPYSHEILVEVTCRNGQEDLVVYSYQFESADDGQVRPVEAVPRRHGEPVEAALAEKDYEPETDLVDATR